MIISINTEKALKKRTLIYDKKPSRKWKQRELTSK